MSEWIQEPEKLMSWFVLTLLNTNIVFCFNYVQYNAVSYSRSQEPIIMPSCNHLKDRPTLYDGDDTEHGHKDIWIITTAQSFSMYVRDIHIFYVPSRQTQWSLLNKHLDADGIEFVLLSVVTCLVLAEW